MKIVDSIGEVGGEVKLKQAILLYGDDKTTVATIHDVDTSKSTPTIMAGHPASSTALQDLVIQLTSKYQSDYLPENILCASFTRIAWWVPSKVRPIWFKPSKIEPNDPNTKTLLKLSGKDVTHPPLVFLATSSGSLFVWALAKNRRPDPKTKLYQAPYWNVYVDGAVCQGSGRVTMLLSAGAIPDYETAFFESNFTHTNLKGGGVGHPGGQAGFWQALRSKRRKDIPLRWLRRTKLTLDGIINKQQFR